MAEDATQNGPNPEQMKRRLWLWKHMKSWWPLVGWIIKGAEPAEVKGTVVQHSGNILILNVDGKRWTVVLPPKWQADDEIIPLKDVYETYLTNGASITMNALKRTVPNGKVEIVVYFGYTIKVGQKTLYSVLPFNINPTP